MGIHWCRRVSLRRLRALQPRRKRNRRFGSSLNGGLALGFLLWMLSIMAREMRRKGSRRVSSDAGSLEPSNLARVNSSMDASPPCRTFIITHTRIIPPHSRILAIHNDPDRSYPFRPDRRYAITSGHYRTPRKHDGRGTQSPAARYRFTDGFPRATRTVARGTAASPPGDESTAERRAWETYPKEGGTAGAGCMGDGCFTWVSSG